MKGWWSKTGSGSAKKGVKRYRTSARESRPARVTESRVNPQRGQRSPLTTLRARAGAETARPSRSSVAVSASRLLALMAVAGTGWAAVHVYRYATTDEWFTVKKIEVRGAERIQTEEILRWSGLNIGVNTFRLPLTSAEERLSRKGCFASVSVSRRLPDTVLIHVEERRPLVSVGGVQLDGEGYVSPRLALSKPGGLPIPFEGGETKKLEVGMRVTDPEILVGLAVAKAIQAQGDILVQRILVQDVMNPRLVLMNGIEVKLGSQRFEEKLARIHDVLVALESKKRLPVSIDLRYRDEAAVTFR